LLAALISQFLVQLAVSMARPVSSYRLLAVGADATAVGMVAAAFALPPMLLAMPFGRWSDRRNPGLLLAAGACLAAVGAFALSRATTVGELALWTALLGIGHLALVVGAQSLIAQSLSAQSLSAQSPIARDATRADGLTSFGLLTVSASLGQMAGPLLGGFLSQTDGPTPTVDSTSLSLAVAALFALVAIPIAAGTLRVQSRATKRAADRRGPESAMRLLRTRGMPAALLASFGSKGSTDLIIAYLPVLGNELGLDARSVGVLLSLSAGAAILARLGMPWLVRRTRTQLSLAVSTAVSGLCIFLLPLGRTFVPLAVLMVVLGFLLALAQTVTMVWVVALASAGSEGSALGLRLAGNRVGQVAVPGLAGLVSGVAGVAAVFSLLGLVMAAITAVVLRDHRRDST
jgi:MFS family permease